MSLFFKCCCTSSEPDSAVQQQEFHIDVIHTCWKIRPKKNIPMHMYLRTLVFRDKGRGGFTESPSPFLEISTKIFPRLKTSEVNSAKSLLSSLNQGGCKLITCPFVEPRRRSCYPAPWQQHQWKVRVGSVFLHMTAPDVLCVLVLIMIILAWCKASTQSMLIDS